MRIAAIILTLMVFSSSAFAECVTNARGRVVCNNGEQAGGYNAKTGNAWKSERNQAGVSTTQTSAGGEARTKNGKGVSEREWQRLLQDSI
jgi:Tfp pilus assembly protein PilX